jgi:hypothetical protein
MGSELAKVQGLGHRGGAPHSEEFGDPVLKDRSVTAAVLGADRMGEGHFSDPATTRGEISGDFAKRREADNCPVWSASEGVHSTSTHHGDTPTAVRSGS